MHEKTLKHLPHNLKKNTIDPHTCNIAGIMVINENKCTLHPRINCSFVIEYDSA